jgi:hypothetical protein
MNKIISVCIVIQFIVRLFFDVERHGAVCGVVRFFVLDNKRKFVAIGAWKKRQGKFADDEPRD